MEKSVASSWKFSKRTQRYYAESVKKERSYRYFPFMVARVLKECVLFQRNGNEFNPKQIAPTIGMKTTPPTEAPSPIAKCAKLCMGEGVLNKVAWS